MKPVERAWLDDLRARSAMPLRGQRLASAVKTLLWRLVGALPWDWQDHAAALVRRAWPGVRDA